MLYFRFRAHDEYLVQQIELRPNRDAYEVIASVQFRFACTVIFPVK